MSFLTYTPFVLILIVLYVMFCLIYIDGSIVGRDIIICLDGCIVGCNVGCNDGLSVIGVRVGCTLGSTVLGVIVLIVRLFVGVTLGTSVSLFGGRDGSDVG